LLLRSVRGRAQEKIQEKSKKIQEKSEHSQEGTS